MPEVDLLLLFVRPLQQADFRYIVTDSVAAIFYGEPRLTLAVDLVVFLHDRDMARLADIFPANDFYLPPPEIIAAEARREQRGHFNIIHLATGFKADLYLTGRDELEAWAFRFLRRVQYAGVPVALAPPEYVIVRKLEYYREDGSEKHVRDVRSMLAVSGGQLDQSVLHEWIQRRGLQAEWKLVSGSWKPAQAAYKNRIALAPAFAQTPPMLARVLSAAVNGIEAFPVEVEVHSGWGDAVISGLPVLPPRFLHSTSIRWVVM